MRHLALTMALACSLSAGCECAEPPLADAGLEDGATVSDASFDAAESPDATVRDATPLDARSELDGGDFACDGTLLSIMPAWQTAICEGYLLCNGAPNSYTRETTAWAESFDDCVRVGSWAARNLWTWALQGPPFGPRRVDCALARECLDATRSVCPDYPPQASRVAMGQGYPDPCTEMWLAPPGVTTGSRCQLTTDCPESDYCDAGVCTPRRSAGEACRYDDECAYDGSGDFGACIASTGVCGGGRKLAFGEAGDACGEVSVSAGVADYVQCRPGLGCDFTTVPTDGTCWPPSSDGGPCRSGGLGRYCELGLACMTDDRCAPFTYLSMGESCAPRARDAWCDPRQSLVCSGGVCTPVGDGRLGAACGVFFANCGSGLRCDVPSGTCVGR